MKQAGTQPKHIAFAASEYGKEKNYWQEKLAGELLKINFPYDYKKITKNKPVPDTLEFVLTGELFTQLMQLTAAKDVRLHMVLAAVVTALLFKYTGNKDIIIGTPIYTQKIAGDFINTVLVLRNKIQDSGTFKELLLQVRKTVSEAVEHQNYPLSTLLYHLNMPISYEEFPLFDVTVLLENIHDRKYLQQVNHNLTFSFLRTADSITGVVEYNSLLYKRESIERVIAHFTRFLQTAVSHIDSRVIDIPILSAEEHDQLLYDFNNTRTTYPQDKSIDTLFKEEALRKPFAVAVVSGDCALTYGELDHRSAALANVLINNGVLKEQAAAIMTERSTVMVIGLLAILKTGGAYLPIDIDYPEERKKYIIQDAGVQWLLTDFSDTVGLAPVIIRLDDPGIYQQDTFFKPVSHSDSTAYIMYTSGSTGSPKGVIVEQRSVVRLVKNTQYVSFSETDSILQTGALEFDASTFEIWGALLNGLKLYLAHRDTILMSGALKETIRKYRVTIMWMTSPLFNQMVDTDIEIFAGIGQLLVGGDVLSPLHINRVRARFPALDVINGYGPTENTTFSTTYLIKRNFEESIPIGKPISNSFAYILDRFAQLIPIGVVGELWVGGDGIARGYLNNPELTDEKFCLRRPPGRRRLYKTGDLARWLGDGNIEFLGRQDHQVKIRGYRIEPGEIETRLIQYDHIKEAVVLGLSSGDGEKYLAAYLTAEKELDISGLRILLAKDLPDYMIPSYFVQVESIPLTPNKKVDIAALPKPEFKAGKKYVAPRDKVENQLVEIWSEVLRLGKEKIGIDADFFELGGHSLKATILINKIHEGLKVKVPLVELFHTPTIRELAQFISGLTGDPLAALESVEEREYYKLSSAQERLYVLDQVELGAVGYNIPQVLVLEGSLDREKLEKSFRHLIRRHESLRTSFHMINDQPVQKIHKEVEFEIEYYDSGRQASRERGRQGERETGNILENSGRQGNREIGNEPSQRTPLSLSPSLPELTKGFIRPFDLSQAPLLRVGLAEMGREKFLLMVDMHHIITDGTSMDILVKEFTALYAGKTLPLLRFQYKDFSAWQDDKRQKEALKNQEAYWLKQFSGDIPVLNLPADYPRPPIRSFAGSHLGFELSPKQSKEINELALSTGTTLFMVLLAIYNVLLSKLSGQEDIIIGTPIAARRHVNLERIIGVFVNTLVLRNYPDSEKSWRNFLKEVKQGALQAFDHQEYQFENLVEQVAVQRDASRNPLFDAMLSIPNMWEESENIPRVDIPGLTVTPYENQYNTAKFDLHLNCTKRGDTLFLTFEYCTMLFKPATIERFIKFFKKITGSILEAPDRKLLEIEIISETEKRQVLDEFNDTSQAFPRDMTIHELFVRQVEKTPDYTALVGIHETHEKHKKNYNTSYMSYKELNQKSHQLAQQLIEKGVIPDTIVAIMVERSIEMIVGILGILKTGGAYLPIDPAYPQDRIAYMLKDSNARILLKKSEIRNPKFETNPNGRNSNDQNERNSIAVLNFEDLDFEFVSDFGFRISDLYPSNLAYLIYTSGSTGKPKGVTIQHSALVNRLNWMQRKYPLGPGDTILQKTVYTFDVSVWEIFWWGLVGARLCLLAPGGEKDPAMIANAVQQQRVTVIHFVPSMLNVFLEYVASVVDLKKLSSLRQVICSGEVLTVAQVKRFNELYNYAKTTRLANLYGPTEAAIDVTYFDCPPNKEIEKIPIGKPIDNIRLYILDKHLLLQPIGIAGELCIAGAGLARGYLNNPELTAGKFLSISYRSYMSYKAYISTKIYKTGDLACWLPDGNIEFFGRIDQQVKIRGFRVEPGEIETYLLDHDNIKEAAVIAAQSAPGEDNYLCAYVVPGKEKELSKPGIREYLLKYLPDYMVPSYFVQLEKMPLTPNGKIDYRALPAPQLETSKEYTAPTTPVEKKLVEIWWDVLGKDTLTTDSPIPGQAPGIDDNFFELGGHSLKAIIMAAKIHKTFQVRLPLGKIFQTPRIRDLAKYIANASKHQYTAVEPMEKREYYELSSAQKRLYMLNQMHLEPTNYNMPYFIELQGELDRGKIEKAFAQIIQRHESFRTSFRMMGEEPVQHIHDKVQFEIIFYNSGRQGERETGNFLKDSGRQGNREVGNDLSPKTPLSLSPSLPEFFKVFIRPFDLCRAPLLRVGLIDLAEKKYMLMIDMHHIISDGTSMAIFFNELFDLYSGKSLPRLTVQYRDFSLWLQKWHHSDEMAAQAAYWLERFAEPAAPLNLPLDYPRPTLLSIEGDTYSLHLPQPLAEKTRKMIAQTNSTLYILLLAAYYVLLMKYTGQEDIVVGTGIAGRRYADLDNIIGLFVNMLAMRNYPQPHKTFNQFLAETRKNTLAAFENQDYQFEELVKKLKLAPNPSRNPLFDTVFQVQNLDTMEINLPALEVKPSPYNKKIARYDLLVFAFENNDDIVLSINYCTKLFTLSTIRKIGSHFIEILEQLVENPGMQLDHVVISSEMVDIKSSFLDDEQGDFAF